MAFHHHDLKDILPQIRMGNAVLERDLFENSFRQNLIWNDLDHFNQRIVTAKDKGILLYGLTRIDPILRICPFLT